MKRIFAGIWFVMTLAVVMLYDSLGPDWKLRPDGGPGGEGNEFLIVAALVGAALMVILAPVYLLTRRMRKGKSA